MPASLRAELQVAMPRIGTPALPVLAHCRRPAAAGRVHDNCGSLGRAYQSLTEGPDPEMFAVGCEAADKVIGEPLVEDRVFLPGREKGEPRSRAHDHPPGHHKDGGNVFGRQRRGRQIVGVRVVAEQAR